MKKILASLGVMLIIAFSLNAASVNPASTTSTTTNAKQVMMPVGNGKFISLADFVTLTPKKFRELTGKRLSLINRLSLKFTQKSIKKDINKDGTIDNNKLLAYERGERFRLHGGGFALGLFLGLIGFIITLFFNDPNRQRRMISSLIGWAVWIVIVLLIII